MAAGMSDYTAAKQAVFETVITAHMRIVQSIIKKSWTYGRYVYVELNAGPGYDDLAREGSPAIALRVAGQLGLPIDAWFCERDRPELVRLRARFATTPGVQILEGDHEQTYERIVAAYQGRRTVFGLVYADSNGSLLPVQPLAALGSGTFSRLDILAHINANGGYKRTRHLHPDRYLADDLDLIGKKHLWVRREEGIWQWTFIIASNWPNFPRFDARGIVPLDSDAGAAIRDRINFTSKERRGSLQPALPFPPRPTPPTPST